MEINRKAFYEMFRVSFTPRVKQTQVNGFEAIFDWWERNGIENKAQLAYCIATAWHETGGRMEAVREGFCKTDAGSINAVTKLYDKGRISTNYSLPEANGQSYFGRGLVQITWGRNYLKLGEAIGVGKELYNHPERALELAMAVKILFVGMTKGLFTGRTLRAYINDSGKDFVNARRVVNGTDRSELIAGYALDFEACLDANT